MAERKKRSIVGKLVLFVVILVIAAVFAVVYYADTLIVVVVESAGSQALGTPTHLEKASLSVLGGSLELKGLQVDNPAGYQNPYLLEMGRCDTKVDLSTLRQETIQIDHIILDDLAITLEQKGLGSNLQEILDHINSKATSAPAKEGKEASGKKVRVHRIEINNARANVKLLPLAGREDTFTITLAPMVLENVGDDSNKAQMLVTVMRKILLSLSQAILESGTDLPGNLLKGLEGSIDQLKAVLPAASGLIIKKGQAILKEGTQAIEQTGQKMKETLKSTEGVMKEGGKAIEEASKGLEEAGKGLEGLFKGGEKKESSTARKPSETVEKTEEATKKTE